MEQTEELLRAEHICKSFGVTKACIDISLSINHGVIHGLIGENGSGKYFLDGQEFKAKTQTEANYKGVSIIVQEQGTLNRLTVAQNIFLGQEARFMKNGLLDQKKMNMEAENILKQYGFKNIKASSLIDNYDFETRKLIEIAKGTYFEPKILVVDETTTALSEDGRNVLYREMQRVKDRGGSVIFISHDMDEIMSKTDYISILRDGRYIDTVKTSNITEDALKELMVGRHMDGKYYRTDYGEPVSDEVVLSAKDITILTNGETAPEFRADNVNVDTREIKEIQGDDKVEGIKFKDGTTLETEGVFIAQGVAGSTEFAKKLGALTNKDTIVVNEKQETNIKGLYACGDCTGGLLQVSKAVYEGANAGLQAIKYVKNLKGGKFEK